MAKLFPNIEVIEKSNTRAEDGELCLIKYLQDNLDEDFEVYFQPFLNGDRPDVVVMKKGFGVYIIEVKDWNLESYRYQKNEKYGEMFLAKNDIQIRTPFEQVSIYKNHLYRFHSESLLKLKLNNSDYYGMVKVGVYFHNENDNTLKNYFANNSNEMKYIAIWGKDSNILKSFKEYKAKNLFSDDLYNEFLIMLKPPIHLYSEGINFNMKRKERKLCISNPGQHVKIKGVAGCGKSLILAHRAVNAVNKTDGKVLILTFNITLKNYIRDRVNQVRENFSWSKFEINHFHLFLSQKINNYGLNITMYEDASFEFNDDDTEAILEQLVDIVDSNDKYDAIFIDEAQDFNKKWFELIEKCFLKNGGEFVLAADEKQKIYERASLGEDKRIETNIIGRWNELNQSFRLGRKIASMAMKFQKEFLNNKYETDVIEIDSDQMTLFDEEIIYTFLDQFNYNDIFEDIKEYMKLRMINYNDVCFLSENVLKLRELEYVLRNKHFINCETVFETKEEYNEIKRQVDAKYNKTKEEKAVLLKLMLYEVRKSRKNNFNMNNGKFKLSTIHSFKGWEIDTVVLILDNVSEDMNNLSNDELIYTALTRGRNRILIYGKGNTKYHDFFKKESTIYKEYMM